MTAHELAKLLLSLEDKPVTFSYFDGGPDLYYTCCVDSVKYIPGYDYIHLSGDTCRVDNPWEGPEDDIQEDEMITNEIYGEY